MVNIRKRKFILFVLPLLWLSLLFLSCASRTDEPESFQSEEKYTGYARESLYIPGFDGTRLATDIIRPQDSSGKPVKEKLPVLFLASRGGRWEKGAIIDRTIVENLISRGYVYVITEMRGCGASFGVNDSFASLENRQDVVAVIQWVNAQPWSSGKVGMLGGSNRGFIQLASATLAPKGLEAITPAVANIDFYYQNYPNGVSALPSRMLSGFQGGPKLSKEEFLEKVDPVDADPDGDMAYQAYVEDQYAHNKNFIPNLLYANMYRDTPNVNFNGEKTNLTIPPVTSSEGFINSGINLYQIGGWFDSNALGLFVAQKQWGGKLLMGPWNHVEAIRAYTDKEKYSNPNIDMSEVYTRWFDFNLKGINNGIDKAPPIQYYTLNARKGEEWRYAESWPLYTARPTVMYFDPSRSGTVSSVNDGTLSPVKPESVSVDSYRVDPSISVFDNRDGKGATYNRMNRTWDGNMAVDVDSKALTFTSQPLFFMYQNEITGVPAVDLWVTTTAPDGDFLVYLEEVKSDGTSLFITEGEIRASHRTSEANEGWDALGATYHPSRQDQCEAMMEEGMDQPVHLELALEPTSYLLSRGSRVRVTITCADTRTYQHGYDENNLPTIGLYKGADRASSITLPFIEHEDNVYNGTVETANYEGPGTLYMFEEKMYLNYRGVWDSWDRNSSDAEYEVSEGKAHFNAGFVFAPEGDPLKDGIVQNYQGGIEMTQPFPSYRHELVSTEPISVHNSLLFVPRTKDLKMDVFRPDTSEKNLPCILYIHGYSRSYSVLPWQLQTFLDEGYVVAGVDLRNYPSNRAPDQINDIKANVRYLRANAERFGIDPERIGAYGVSLGGNMTLMLAVSGDEEETEGSVGGNLDYSSRIQAAVAGFAWSDVLYMGKDLEDEYSYDPEMVQKKLARSDGANAPSSEVIGFAGPGRGIGVLRAYIEAGLEGTNPEYDEAIAAAKLASPVYHISPDDPPVALFHGLGMTRVDIPNNQSYRTFDALSRNDVRAFMFSNTQGEYGEAPEIQAGVVDFFNNYLKNPPSGMKMAFRSGSSKAVVNYITKEMPAPAVVTEAGVLVPVEFLAEVMPDFLSWDQDALVLTVTGRGDPVSCSAGESGKTGPDTILREQDGRIYAQAENLSKAMGAVCKWFEESRTLTIVK